MPDDCMSAYIVVGPTNRKPSFLSALLIARDSGVTAGSSPSEVSRAGRGGGAKLHMSSSSAPDSLVDWASSAGFELHHSGRELELAVHG